MAKVTEVRADSMGLWHAIVTAETKREAMAAGRARILHVLIQRERKTTETQAEARERLNAYLRVSVRAVSTNRWQVWEV